MQTNLFFSSKSDDIVVCETAQLNEILTVFMIQRINRYPDPDNLRGLTYLWLTFIPDRSSRVFPDFNIKMSLMVSE